MFNKSVLLVLATVGFAVAFPTGPSGAASLARYDSAQLVPGTNDGVKLPSLARRAESCSSDYTLTYCKEVVDVDSNEQFIHKLLQAVNADAFVTGLVGLSCTPAKTTTNTHALCSKKMNVKGMALNSIEATLN